MEIGSAATLAILLAMGVPQSALAAAKDAGCPAVNEEFEKFNAVKNDAVIDPSQAAREELRLRKSLLRAVIDCALRDVKTLENAVGVAAPDAVDSQLLRKRFLEQLRGAGQYYASQKNLIENLTIRGSKDLSRSIRDWREASYAPLQENALNFIMWAKNQELVQTAQNRFQQIKQTVRSLNLMQHENIRSLFLGAESDLVGAMELNQRVKRTLEQHDPSRDALPLIKQALEALGLTYQDFLDLSNAVQKVLPR